MSGEPFEEHRAHLRAVAYRMLGSPAEADDAVQEAWLRMDRADIGGVHNLRGWLTTVVARICLDMLRARSARPEQPLDDIPAARQIASADPVDPEQEAELADSIGVALLVILQNLSPAERLAFVLHDMFDLPFAEIAPIVGRSENTAAQLASRARRRVRGKTRIPQRISCVSAGSSRRFWRPRATATSTRCWRCWTVTSCCTSMPPRPALPTTIRGAAAVGRNARLFSANARFAEPALVDDAVGIVVAPEGRLALVLRFSVTGELISEITIDAEPARLRRFNLAVLP